MSEKTFWVGSVGPLLYDDTDKSYEDSDMIDGDVVSPLQKALWAETPEAATNLPTGGGGGGTDTVPPGAPSGLYLLSSGMGGITIGWVAPADADIDNYSIYWSTSSTYIEGTTALIATVPAPATTYTHVYTHPLTTAFTCYYWVKALDKYKNVSILAGPLTVAATTTYDDAINKTVNALANTPVANGVSFKTDKFTISPPGSETISPTAIFTVGTIDGNPSIAIRGDLFVTGSINGSVITANTITGNHINATSTITLNTGGILRIGNTDIELASDVSGGVGNGRIRVWDKTAGGNNRSLFWRGAFSHYNDLSGETICQVPPRQMSSGVGNDGQQIEINGEYPFMPTVITFPMKVNPNVSDCLLVCHPGPVTYTGYDAGRCQFRMYCFTTSAKGIQTSGIQPRVYTTYTYPSLPATLQAPGSAASQYYTATSNSDGVAKLFVKVSFRTKTNSGYGIRGTVRLHVGYDSGGSFVQTDSSDGAYEAFADQDWRSMWILCTPASTGRRFFKVSFIPNAFIYSRYEGIGNRLEMYVDAVFAYNQTWGSNYVSGTGGYVAYC